MWADRNGAGDVPDAAVAARRRGMPAMVRDAVARGRVALAYQPVVQALRPERIAFHEGLIRVFDPQDRIVPAREFMAAVEPTATGREIDRLALELGFEALAEAPDLRLAINMSARSIGYPRWLRSLRQGLMRDPTAGERLVLEIGEGSALQVPELVMTFMADFARQGVSFALDDFGAGRTSLRHLREFRFDLMKIDGACLRGVGRDPENQVLVAAIRALAEAFDLLTVAEAVERPEDAEWLAAAGIHCLQGYFFAAPTVEPPWRGRGASGGGAQRA